MTLNIVLKRRCIIKKSKLIAVITLLSFWVLTFTAQITGLNSPFDFIVNLAVSIMILAHLVEYLMVRTRLAKTGRSKIYNFLAVLFFGVVYWKPILSDQESNQN